MKKGKTLSRLLSPVLALAIVLSFTAGVSAAAEVPSSEAVYSLGNMNFQGSAIIKGDGVIASGSLSGGYNAYATGHIYAASGVSVVNPSVVNQPIVKSYTGAAKNFTFNSYKSFPGTECFKNFTTDYKDGTQSLTVGYSSPDKSDGYTINTNCFFENLEVKNNLTLNISVPAGQVRVIRADTLLVQGNVNISGGGRVVLYVDHLGSCSNTHLNTSSTTDKLTVIVSQVSDNNPFGGSAVLNANFIFLDSVHLTNPAITGNIYVQGTLNLDNSVSIRGLVYAPASQTTMGGSAYIIGKLVTGSLTISGSSFVQYGPYSGLPSDVASMIGDSNDSQMNDGGSTTPTTTTTTPATSGSSTTETTVPTTATTSSGNPDNPDSGTVTITVTVARRMSIRLEDGRVLKNGDKFTMAKGGTVRFQVCTNNWTTNTYTDNGQGIAGQKVFSYTNLPNKELVLRVDNNRYFVPVKFHFVKGDYSKQTGVKNVLSTPLESLSINFPIGATITVDAYVGNKVVESKDLFIDSSLNGVNWNY